MGDIKDSNGRPLKTTYKDPDLADDGAVFSVSLEQLAGVVLDELAGQPGQDPYRSSSRVCHYYP